VNRLDRFHQRMAFAFGQPAGDLIEQQKLWVGRHGARQFQALALKQRQRAGGLVGAVDKLSALQNHRTSGA
jgi:hypothetical protein